MVSSVRALRVPAMRLGPVVMTYHHSLEEANRLAESLDDDGPDYQVKRELRIQLRALLKDQENAA